MSSDTWSYPTVTPSGTTRARTLGALWGPFELRWDLEQAAKWRGKPQAPIVHLLRFPDNKMYGFGRPCTSDYVWTQVMVQSHFKARGWWVLADCDAEDLAHYLLGRPGAMRSYAFRGVFSPYL